MIDYMSYVLAYLVIAVIVLAFFYAEEGNE